MLLCVILHRFFGLVLFLPLRSGSACHPASFHAFEKSAVQAILGHKNFSTTANKYVSHNDPAYLLQEMQKMKY